MRTKVNPISVRLTPVVKAALAKAAEDDGRPVSQYIERVLTEHLRRAGALAAPKQQQRVAA